MWIQSLNASEAIDNEKPLKKKGFLLCYGGEEENFVVERRISKEEKYNGGWLKIPIVVLWIVMWFHPKTQLNNDNIYTN